MQDNVTELKAKKNQRGLGRGLASLFGDYSVDETVQNEMQKEAIWVAPEDLRPGKYQPRNRDRITDENIAPLCQSIKQHGVLQPLLVRPLEEKGHYEIIAGERRWHAAKKEKIAKLPVIIKMLNDNEALEIGLIENLQRDDLNSIEEADSLHRLMNEFGYTQQKIGIMIGKSKGHVSNIMRLRASTKKVKQALVEGKISDGHARALLVASNPDAILDKIIAEHLTVRQTENLIKGSKISTPKKRLRKSAELKQIEKRVANLLDTPVKINMSSKNTGKCTITFHSVSHLNEIIEKMLSKN